MSCSSVLTVFYHGIAAPPFPHFSCPAPKKFPRNPKTPRAQEISKDSEQCPVPSKSPALLTDPVPSYRAPDDTRHGTTDSCRAAGGELTRIRPRRRRARRLGTEEEESQTWLNTWRW